MLKKKYLFFLILMTLFFTVKNVNAYDSNNYKYKALCGNYEVAAFHTDGGVIGLQCFNSYSEAKNYMTKDGHNDLGILTKVGGVNKLIDANVGILDLTVNPDQLTYYYRNSELTGSSYTYMANDSGYGGVDGAHIETHYSSSKGWTVKVKIGSFTGWIKENAYEIVPVTWVKSISYYKVTDDSIKHVYINKVQNNYTSSYGCNIGPKPEMLPVGNYYSYDGNYFYNSIDKMILDYKNGNYNNAVNKNNPYYNYYLYLSNHTRTAYSSVNIDEYIRNNLGYQMNVYGNSASSNTSRLYGMGTFFYYAQEKYGVNAVLSLSLSRNETGNGRSNLAINKNNGFGLNAVDSNPIQAANWYASFPSSILGYASKWTTYGFLHPRDWRYFGPQFGNKMNGMNVKYASGVYWSEEAAAHYYNLDRALGLQDYNYYQLGLVNGPANAFASPSLNSRIIYTYPEKDDALVIVGEVKNENETWYKVVSDLNIDSNYNEITSGDYNWNGEVYVLASTVTKINKGKNGYISPNKVTKYIDKDYEYDLFVENTTLKPKVALSIKETPYYYDSSLTSKTGSTLLNDRAVMVYTAAYKNKKAVAYLVTSDYFYDQKHWVSADSIQFTNLPYGKVTVSVSGNQYTWVNYNQVDAQYSLISGLYTNTYVPVLEEKRVGNDTWLTVPVSLSNNNHIHGYTLKQAPGVQIDIYQAEYLNTPPTINVTDKEFYEGEIFDPKKNVTAMDKEDGDITSKIEIKENTVNNKVSGTYKIVYKIKDSYGVEVTKEIKVVVKEKIQAQSISLEKNEYKIENDTEEILKAVIEPSNTTDKTIKWSSSDESILTVDETGKVVTLKEGEANVTVETINGKKATSKVIVTRGKLSVSYKTHVQSYGWQNYVKNGEMSGTSKEAKRLEAIKIKLVNSDYAGNILYRTHIESYGWEKEFKKNDEASGTEGEAKRLEAIEIKLDGEISNHYDIYYRVHAQSYGWLGWARNGERAGTSGQSLRLEGIEIKLVEKNQTLEEYGEEYPFRQKKLSYETHVQTYGWQDAVSDGELSGTTGEAKRLEGIKINLVNQDYPGDILYRTHIQTFGWEEEFKKNGEMSGTSGLSKRLEAIEIQLTGEMSEHYDIYYRVHAQTFGWLDWAKNGERAGTAGLSKRLEGIEIILVEKDYSPPYRKNKNQKQAFIENN